ncbi:unnamed protein product [Phytophthora lilii]|uniref:Unnamed protein product n=1 Tax=Phytophthora lilii TaxID=2077276 RepID=A0A9W6TFP2_9STRA|nr:unnamed protein product [Phytophthora lilii]
MTPSTGASTAASPAKSGALVSPPKEKAVAAVEPPPEKPASNKRRRDRKAKPKPKPKKRETAQCVGYYIDALDKKMLWGEARIIQCNLTTQKIKVHFVGWSKNYDLWTDPMSITAHGRYAPRTKKDKSVKSWDGDMHLFEDMLGTIEETTFTPVPVPAESKSRVTSSPASAKKKITEKKASSKTKAPSSKLAPARQPERSALKRKAVVLNEEKAGSESTTATAKTVTSNGHMQDPVRSSKRANVVVTAKENQENQEERQEPTRSSKRQKREPLQPAATAAPTSAKARPSKKKRAPSPDELPMFRDLELDDGTVVDFSVQREEARAEREAMKSFLDKCALIWKEQLNTQSHKASGHASPDKSPRKASSFPSLAGEHDSPGYWGELRAQHQEEKEHREEATTNAEVVSQATTSQNDDVSLMLDIEGRPGRFSDDDSDGSSYSSVCSNDEHSPTPSASSAGSSSVTSSSPLLRRAPPAAGFEVLHSEASSLDSIPRQDNPPEKQTTSTKEEEEKPTFSIEVPLPDNFSPKQSHGNLRVTEDAAGDSDDDLPDWLRERIVLSPAASMTKMSARSPQQIEEEIRFAVDSAAARVQQELGRREQFHYQLQSAAACPIPAMEGSQSATSKLFLSRVNESDKCLSTPDDILNEKEGQALPNHDVASDGAQGDLLLLMEVVIGVGRTETIEIHECDNPEVLASAFAQKHGLQPDAVFKLKGLIQEQLNDLAEAEQQESECPEQRVADEWTADSRDDCFVSPPLCPSVSGSAVAEGAIVSNLVSSQQQERVGGPQQIHERENHREYSYNNLMARYGHYSQHSGKIDPEGGGNRRSVSSDTHTSRNSQAVEYTGNPERMSASATAPSFTTMIHSSRTNSLKKKPNLADAPAYERLYALAESKDKWIQRAQKAKELEKARDEERLHRVELMAAKSRELVANRTNGGYAHIGERLHDEALSDIAKKVQRYERRVVEREQQQDWMCPKCAFVNQYTDSRCQNIVALAGQTSKSRGKSPTSSNSRRRETVSSTNSSFGFLESHPEVLCGQPKPDRLFQPTLLTTSASVMKAVSANKEKSTRVANIRRQRHQLAIEEEFQQTCPFRPKINNVSEEIVREKLETAAAAAAVHGETRKPRNPHLELYENSFQARALREEREQEYFKQFPFKPDIGVNALWVASDKSQSDFVERLAVDKYHELERKRVALYDKYALDRDPQTGKELFKPEVGRAPAFARNKQGLPIGDFLHAAHREQQEYHRQLREKDQREIKKKSQQTFVSEASRQALERRKADTCLRIFNALLALSCQSQSSSSPPESSASSKEELSKQTENAEPQSQLCESQQEENSDIAIPSRVNLSALPKEISRVVAIVFEYANHAPMSRDAFSGYMDRLVREVPGITYSQIIFLAEHLHTDRGGRHRHQMHHSDPEREAALAAAERKELTFHPVIDKNSREIATKHGRVSSSKVFHALNQYYDHYLERKEQLRKQQQREFKKSHPFHPTLVTKAHQREPAAAAFYDKIRMGNCDDSGNTITWGATTSVSSAPTSYRNAGGMSQPPPAPLQTAISNARPCVRPIENERSRFYTAASADEVQLDELAGNMSRSSSSSQLGDAELTSRVLAALDEKPSLASPPPAPSPYHLTKTLSVGDTSSANKECSVRSPEDTAVRSYEFTDMGFHFAMELVHPVSGRTMAAPQLKTTFVLYALVGEELEPAQESKQRAPDTNWNAFVLPLPPAGGRVTLADVQKAFPLGSSFHFAFRCEDGAYLDLTNPESAVPFCGRKILARITPLDQEPSVEYLHYEETRAPAQNPAVAKLRTESYGSSTAERRSHRSDDYEEFESTTYESQGSDVARARIEMRKEQVANDWSRNSYQSGGSGYQNAGDGNRGSRFERDDRYDSSGSSGPRQSSEWAEAGKDAQAYLRKQTEQAYDFAKKISIEDAKKGATEAAKKAKKWGGSLLSSISATISSASANVSKVSLRDISF